MKINNEYDEKIKNQKTQLVSVWFFPKTKKLTFPIHGSYIEIWQPFY